MYKFVFEKLLKNLKWYHKDLEKRGARGVVAYERPESHVSQYGDCYKKRTFAEISPLFKIVMVCLIFQLSSQAAIESHSSAHSVQDFSSYFL